MGYKSRLSDYHACNIINNIKLGGNVNSTLISSMQYKKVGTTSTNTLCSKTSHLIILFEELPSPTQIMIIITSLSAFKQFSHTTKYRHVQQFI